MQINNIININTIRERFNKSPFNRLPLKDVFDLWENRKQLKEDAFKRITERFPQFSKGLDKVHHAEKNLLRGTEKFLEKADTLPIPKGRVFTFAKGLINRRLEKLEPRTEEKVETEPVQPEPAPVQEKA